MHGSWRLDFGCKLEDTNSGDETLMKTPADAGKLESAKKSKVTGKRDDEGTSILKEVFHDYKKAADQCPELDQAVDFKSPLASQLYEKRKIGDIAMLDQRPAGVSNSIITDNEHTLNGALDEPHWKAKEDKLTNSNVLSECRSLSETKKLKTSNSDLSDFIDHLIM